MSSTSPGQARAVILGIVDFFEKDPTKARKIRNEVCTRLELAGHLIPSLITIPYGKDSKLHGEDLAKQIKPKVTYPVTEKSLKEELPDLIVELAH